MRKLKAIATGAVALVGTSALALVCHAESYLNASDTSAISTAMTQGSTDIKNVIVSYVLPACLGAGVLILAIFIGWRMFKKFAGGR